MTDTLIATLSEVSFAGESLMFEAAAMETVAQKHLTRKTARPINNVLVCTGCESLYTMSTQISQEGIVDWVKDKLSKIGRKINVAINKIYAFVTRADQATKDLIDQASHDDTIALPISGGKATAILAAGAAVIGGVIYFATKGPSDDAEKGQGIFKSIAAKIDAIKENRYQMATAKRNIKKAKADADYHAKLALGSGSIHSAQGQKHRAAKSLAGKRVEAATDALRGAQAKTFLGKLRGMFANLGKAFKNFANSFRSAESQAKSAAAAPKESVWSKLKGYGRSVSNAFKLAWKWIAAIPGKFKKEKAKA